MDVTGHIQALIIFRNNSAEVLRHIKEAERPMVLTVNGNAAVVVRDAAAYQRLLDITEQSDVLEGS